MWIPIVWTLCIYMSKHVRMRDYLLKPKVIHGQGSWQNTALDIYQMSKIMKIPVLWQIMPCQFINVNA